MQSGSPITPDEVVEFKKKVIFPPEVINAFNELIARNFSGGTSKVYATEAANLIAERLSLAYSQVTALKYLDVEEVYRDAGWIVEYDQPGYNETYAAFFKFSKKK